MLMVMVYCKRRTESELSQKNYKQVMMPELLNMELHCSPHGIKMHFPSSNNLSWSIANQKKKSIPECLGIFIGSVTETWIHDYHKRLSVRHLLHCCSCSKVSIILNYYYTVWYYENPQSDQRLFSKNLKKIPYLFLGKARYFMAQRQRRPVNVTAASMCFKGYIILQFMQLTVPDSFFSELVLSICHHKQTKNING